ncbi:MAG: zinc-ribbon domain-containing protein [Fimbriiglobus sp.]|jgi:LSD1 subclass zinc finger protein|nr:zinc-ribbon domain-containing protein [Fimbriiglobus sp.]
MPDSIVCPQCREQLDIPAEYHGRKVRCASCQNVFAAIPTGGPPVVRRSTNRPSADRPPWQDEADRPSRPPARDDHDSRLPRQSNIGVVLLLLVVGLTVGGFCGGINLLMMMLFNPPMTPYTSAEGKFKVEFPGESPSAGPIAAGENDKDGGWQATTTRPMTQERYSVRTYKLKPAWAKLPPYDALRKVAETELPGVKFGEGSDTKIAQVKHATFDALDVLSGQGGGMGQVETVTRCILAGERVYVLSAQVPQNNHIAWWVQQFFLSFEITDPAAQPKKPADNDG